MNRVDLRLYGLLDPARSGERDLAHLAAAAAEGGAGLLQLRDKTGSTRDMIRTAREIRSALAGSDVPLLINDRVDVALAAEADGVHLGQDDMAAEDARRLLGPDAIIGLTIKSDMQARQAPYQAIDYVAIGGVFETLSKHNPDPPVGLEGLSRIASTARQVRPGLPIAAIAGMDGPRAPAVISAGADGLAVVSALFMQDDVVAAARDLRAAIDNALAQRQGA